MRRELEKYYEANFGSFSYVRATAISAFCLEDYAILDMPGVLLFKKGRVKVPEKDLLPETELVSNIVRNLAYSIN